MDSYEITGNKKLKGRVKISGSKNAALPCLFATLLTDKPCTLERIPELADIDTSIRLLKTLGKKVSFKRGVVKVSKGTKLTGKAPYDLVRRMRASVLVMGPLLARSGKASVSMPGGCAIGARPINYHLDGYSRMGVQIKIKEGYVQAKTKKMEGAIIPLPYPSVGATENLMMAAVLAEGTTRIRNAAREPEIVDLGHMLRKMGASIYGLGTSEILIQGVSELNGTKHEVIPDRIEAATYLLAAAITKGDITLEGIRLPHLNSLLEKATASGLSLKVNGSTLRVRWKSKLKPVGLLTEVFPGFPTDMQAQWIALMSVTPGQSRVRESVFENRFLHVQELLRFGANIKLRGRDAIIRGVVHLSGCTVMVSDLRAGAALVLAGLAAKGTTKVLRIYHLDRGYEKMEHKLRKLGAKIKRVKAN